MQQNEINSSEFITIDVFHIVKMLWKRAWIVVLSGFLSAVIAFSYVTYCVDPTYSSSVMLYVNNTSFSLGNTNFSISSSQISAAQSLVRTYSEILNNRTTLERVIKHAGVNHKPKDLARLIESYPSNDTEIMKVTVTTTDPYEASNIANSIAVILPIRISEIIDGATMEVIDSAVPDINKVAPSRTKYTFIGGLIGGVLSVGIICLFAIMDNTIHDEDYILRTYKYPILAKVPNLLSDGSKSDKSYNYYYSSGSSKKSE